MQNDQIVAFNIANYIFEEDFIRLVVFLLMSKKSAKVHIKCIEKEQKKVHCQF